MLGSELPLFLYPVTKDGMTHYHPSSKKTRLLTIAHILTVSQFQVNGLEAMALYWKEIRLSRPAFEVETSKCTDLWYSHGKHVDSDSNSLFIISSFNDAKR